MTNCVETYIELDGRDAEEFETLLAAEASEEVREMETTWAERITAEYQEKFREQGLAEGRAKGRAQGMRTIVTRLLEERFGELPPRARRKVAAMRSDRRLEEVATQLLTAKSLAELGLD